MNLSVEMNLDQLFIAREGYTFLEVLSDVGGLEGLLLSFTAAILVIFNHNNFDNYLASRLYKVKDDSESDSSPGGDSNSGFFLEPTKFCNIYEYMLDTIPSRLKCKRCNNCRKPRKMEDIEQARIQMAEEINIVEIIKSQRYVSMALRLLLSKTQRNILKEKSRYNIID